MTEQYYLQSRYYNPVLGRFLQEDEYRGDGLNLYAYCGNNPVRYYNPSGYARDEAQNNYQPLGEVAGDGSEGKIPTARELAELANNSAPIDGLSGVEIPYDLAFKAASEFTGQKNATLGNRMFLFSNRDGTKTVRIMPKIRSGLFQANFETKDSMKNVLTNYHVDIIQD